MNKNNTYGIEIADYRDEDNVKRVNLDGWTKLEDAINTAWELIEMVASFDPNLDYENQGDQLLAFYADGVTDKDGKPLEGIGAVIFKITNPDGTYYEDI